MWLFRSKAHTKGNCWYEKVSRKVTCIILKKKNRRATETHTNKKSGKLMLQYRSQKFEIEENPRDARPACLVNRGLLPEHSMSSNFMVSDLSRWAPVTWGETPSKSPSCAQPTEFSATAFGATPAPSCQQLGREKRAQFVLHCPET